MLVNQQRCLVIWLNHAVPDNLQLQVGCFILAHG